MLFSKLLTLLAVLAPALVIVWLQHQAVARQQESNSRLRGAIADLEEEIDTFENIRPGVHPIASAVIHSAPPQLPIASPATAGVTPRRPESGGEIPYVTLSKSHLKDLELAPFTDDFKLTDEVCAVLGLSSSERAVLHQALAGLVAAQQKMDVSRVQMTSEHLAVEVGRKTTFKVSAYPEEGRKLAEELIAQAQAAIGSERTELLLGFSDLNSLSAEGYEPFGRTEKTITFLDRENPDGTRGNCEIHMKIVDTVSGVSLSTSFANRDDAIPRAWRHLIQNIAPAP